MPLSPRTLRPSSSFTPKSISGLALWLDASATGDLFQNSDGTVPAVNSGDPVGYWRDRSGNGRNVTNSTSTKRPTVSSESGRKALAFDGVDDNLNATPSSAVGSTAVTHIAVVKNNLTSQPTYLSASWGLSSGSAGRPLERWQSLSQNRIYTSDATATDVTSPFRSLSDRFIYCLDGQKDGVATNQHRLREFINGAQIFSVTGNSSTWSTTGQKFNLGTRDDNGTQYKGNICEVLCYDKILSVADRQKIERYLAAKWGITLAPQVSNADAQDWVNRVYANGGTVSASTASAVNQFCNDIDSAGIRDRFYRLNLFCGTGLNACLVPLYRGPSLGGTQYGNTTDTNVGPFVSGDYVETGASGGLTGNGSSKYLNTGVPGNTMTVANRHLSSYEITRDTGAYKVLMGTQDNGAGTYFYALENLSPGTSLSFHCGPQATLASQSSGAHWIGSDQAASAMSLYKNGASAATSSGTNKNTPSVQPILVFALNQLSGSVSAAGYSSSRLGGYSMGLSLSDSQAAAYYTAMQAFQTALGRNV